MKNHPSILGSISIHGNQQYILGRHQARAWMLWDFLKRRFWVYSFSEISKKKGKLKMIEPNSSVTEPSGSGLKHGAFRSLRMLKKLQEMPVNCHWTFIEKLMAEDKRREKQKWGWCAWREKHSREGPPKKNPKPTNPSSSKQIKQKNPIWNSLEGKIRNKSWRQKVVGQN